MADDERPRVTPSAEAFRANWRNSTLPFFEKLAMSMRNNFTKMRTGQNCCGNLGEPGC